MLDFHRTSRVGGVNEKTLIFDHFRKASAKMADPVLVTFGYPFEAAILAMRLQDPSQTGPGGSFSSPRRASSLAEFLQELQTPMVI